MTHYGKTLSEIDCNLFDDSLENKENFKSFNKNTFILEKPKTSIAYLIKFTPKKNNSDNKIESTKRLNSTVTIKNSSKINSTFTKSEKKKCKKDIKSENKVKYKDNLASLDFLNQLKNKILNVKNDVINGKNNKDFINDFKYLNVFESNLNVLLNHLLIKIKKNDEIEKIKLYNIIKIQSFWRKCLARKRYNYLKELKNNSKQDSILNNNLELVEDKIDNNLIKKKFIIIRAFKTYMFRKSINELVEKRRNKSCLIIQKAWKNYCLRKNLKIIQIKHQLRKINSILIIQRTWRKYYLRRNESAKIIQKTWKSYLLRKNISNLICRRQFNIEKICAIKIQKAWKKYKLNKLLKDAHSKLLEIKLKSAKIIQKNWRNYMFKVKLQNLINKKKETFELKNKSAIIIQTFWRGYSIRKRNFIENKKTAIIVKRISEANKNAGKKQTIGKITEMAIQKLVKYKYHETALQHLIELESTTSMSDESCIQVASANTVKVLIKVISECNRSHPCLEIIKKSISIILNLAKCNKTFKVISRTFLLKECIMDTLIKHHKNTAILLKCMTLLYILLQNEGFPNTPALTVKINRLLNKISQNYKFLNKNPIKIYHFDPRWCTKKNMRSQFCTTKQALDAFYNIYT